MLERHIRVLMEAGYPVIVRVPTYRRRELEKEDILVPEYIDGKIIEIKTAGPHKQANVVIRDGMGRDIEIRTRNVIKLRGRGHRGKNFATRPTRRNRRKKQKMNQMDLF